MCVILVFYKQSEVIRIWFGYYIIIFFVKNIIMHHIKITDQRQMIKKCAMLGIAVPYSWENPHRRCFCCHFWGNRNFRALSWFLDTIINKWSVTCKYFILKNCWYSVFVKPSIQWYQEMAKSILLLSVKTVRIPNSLQWIRPWNIANRCDADVQQFVSFTLCLLLPLILCWVYTLHCLPYRQL